MTPRLMTMNSPRTVHQAVGTSNSMNNNNMCHCDIERPTTRPSTLRLDDTEFSDEKKEPQTPNGEFRTTKPILSSPKPLLRQRQKSDGHQRRAIFEGFWKQNETTPQKPRSLSDPLHSLGKRSSSCSILDQLRALDTTSDLCTDLSPSREKVEATGEHFRHIGELPVSKGALLPRVPYPLKRFYQDDGKLACLGGAYPMVARPRSILRQSSYRTLKAADRKVASFGGVNTTFNLTDTRRNIKEETDDEDLDLKDSDESDAKDSSSHSSNSRAKTIHFDPRVTVTEYPDNFHRKWYSENELEMFKSQTVLLAQRYLVRHPKFIEKYNKPFLDPVTRTMRKRALFSLPVFSTTSGQEQEGGPQLVRNDSEASRQFPPEDEIKTILIVDRNAMILELFRRSLQSLFPYAEITTLNTAEDALVAFEDRRSQNQGRSFDVVIAEERLHKPLCGFGKPLVRVGKATSFPAGSTRRKEEPCHRRSGSDHGQDD